MNTYVVGDLVQIKATFTNASGVLANPTDVTAEVKNPDSSVTALSPSQISLGIFAATVSITQAGQYQYRFVGTGAVQAANEGSFFVNTSAFGS